MPKGSLYSQVYHLTNLRNSWDTVRKNGLQSQSEKTVKEVRDFENGTNTKLLKIQKELRSETFFFSMSKGIPVKRDGGKQDRPLVVSPVENRIVQRAILNVLQREEGIQELVKVKTSFGGIEKRNVEAALKLVVESMNNGANYFARSDIKSFFTRIPKSEVLGLIKERLSQDDEKFDALLSAAITTELENLEALGEKASLFPLDDTGVAQGSCLSPLLGNIFLERFDKLSNTEDVTCVRYVDDYLILGPSEKAVKSVFVKGKKFLNEKKLDIYDPYEKEGKGKKGHIKEGFEFLGCAIQPDRITPSQSSVDRIKLKIVKRMNTGFYEDSFAQTISAVNNIVKGWGNSYSFCNNDNLIKIVDEWLIVETKKFKKKYISALLKFENPAHFMKKLGIEPLSDCRKNPIIKASVKQVKA